MLSLDKLAALDLSLWLRSGYEAGERLGISQSNVIRRRRQCLDLLDLQLHKHDDEWDLRGPALGLELLALERQVHHHARWQGYGPLRIEGTYWSGPLLLTPPPPGWLGGLHNTVGISRPLRWLRDGVIDAWLAGGPDWPDADDPELAVLPLSQMPVHLVVAPDHPLLRQLEHNAPLSWDDVAAFPSLALPPGAYSKVEAALQALGLWNSPVRMSRYRHDRWEGRSAQDVTVGYATVLSEQVAPGLVRLPLPLPFTSGEALVLRRCWLEHPHTQALVKLLRLRLQPWADRHPELVLAP
ncbi:MAG: LysR substrate-binding domain-containing protein [Vulcanococcus sp.]